MVTRCAPAGALAWAEADYRVNIAQGLPDGLFNALDLQVTVTGQDRVLRVNPGRARVQGVLFHCTAGTAAEPGATHGATVTVPSWEGTNGSALLVLRYDPNAADADRVTLRLLTSTTSTPPIPTRQVLGVWDFPLTQVRGTGTASITTAVLTDVRRMAFPPRVQRTAVTSPATSYDANIQTSVNGWVPAFADNAVNSPIELTTDGWRILEAGYYEGWAQIVWNATAGGVRTMEIRATPSGQASNILVLDHTPATSGSTGYRVSNRANWPPVYLTAGTLIAIFITNAAPTTGSATLFGGAGRANMMHIRRVDDVEGR